MSTSAEHWWLGSSLFRVLLKTDSVIVWSHRQVLWDDFLCSVKNCFAARRQELRPAEGDVKWNLVVSSIVFFFRWKYFFRSWFSDFTSNENFQRLNFNELFFFSLVVIVICEMCCSGSHGIRVSSTCQRDFNWKKIVLVELRGWNPLSCNLWDVSRL